MSLRTQAVCGRRASATAAVVVGSLAADLPSAAGAAPFNWNFLYDKEAPGASNQGKQRGLPPEELAEILRKDLAVRRYILTGDLTPGIFTDGCRFVDPNNAVDGLGRYQQVREMSVAAGGKSIDVDYVAEGVLKLPWRPHVAPWSGHLVYSLNADGLIASQVDTWNITRMDALRQTFSLR